MKHKSRKYITAPSHHAVFSQLISRAGLGFLFTWHDNTTKISGHQSSISCRRGAAYVCVCEFVDVCGNIDGDTVGRVTQLEFAKRRAEILYRMLLIKSHKWNIWQHNLSLSVVFCCGLDPLLKSEKKQKKNLHIWHLCKVFPSVRVCKVKTSLIADFKLHWKYYFRGSSALWVSSLCKKKMKIICATSNRLSRSASNGLELDILQRSLKEDLYIN